MKAKLACLSLAAFAFASCDKSGTKTNPEETSSNKPRAEARTNAPTIAEKTANAQRDSHGPAAKATNAQTLSHPVTAEMIRAAGAAPEDGPWESLTAEQMIGKYNSSGIAHLPKEISDKIVAAAASAGTPEDQVGFITQQAAAWHRINEFSEDVNNLPEHMKRELLMRLSTKHGDSWKDMATELDEQLAANSQVIQLRMNGIPGMPPDESQDFIIGLLEKHGPDYKTILSIANQRASK